ncbi:LysR family transcriptional regulator [Rhodococcus erythropolis]|uniref:LysR family transcriptional regulator n=1 Tax=Rhodococcus erythropolis TaxID=1833 RepID=UPI0029499B57|nr:LysR family transcriptional regulator [Rhodococcus erythropolis]MDV6211626.1 LysR family transcriptional regulator [Rhodococcus erythropolis]
METRRLHLLLELSRLGSMRAVAEAHNLTTSTVSQQLAALTAETGTALIEPEGRRVRLTPAGQRLADHAVTILAAVDAARLDLDPTAEPEGTLRVGGFATAVRTAMLPVALSLQHSHPQVDVVICEYEPAEAFDLLERDDLDLALTYDYNLAPASPSSLLEALPLWSTPWGLCVPDNARTPDESTKPGIDLRAFADTPWIVNSRNTADERAVRTLASLAGFTPRITHQIDSLDLVELLILSGYGVGLMPLERKTREGVRVVPLTDPPVILTAYAVTRRGRSSWPPLRLVLDRLTAYR